MSKNAILGFSLPFLLLKGKGTLKEMEGSSEKKQLSLYYLSNKYFLNIWVRCKEKVEIKKSIVKQLVLEGKGGP